MLLALSVAELAARRLTPRDPLPKPVPVAARDYFSAEEIARGAGYARPQLALGLARGACQLAVLLGALGYVRRGAGRSGGGPLTGAGVGAGLAAGTTAAGLPIAALARRRAGAVGLVTQSWGGWAIDVAKATAIESALSALAGAAVVGLTARYPQRWWAPAAGGSVLLGAALGALAPVLLDPVFNDFTPLEPGPLRADVLELAGAAGVSVGEVFSVDASRRTTAANAYVTGLGPTKRIVLFDTLTSRYSREEVRSVVAHELAHVRHRDVLRGVTFGAAVAGPAALATQRLSWSLAPGITGAAALPALVLAAGALGAPIGLMANRVSRAIERRADAFALGLTDPEAFISFERAVVLQNVADPDPPRWLTKLLATHPPTTERIGAALAATARSRRTPAGS